MRWRALATLDNLDEIGTYTMYPGSAPHGGGKDLLLLDYIDGRVYKSSEARMEAMEGKWNLSLLSPGQALYR